jgi:hypothetical protein
LPPISEFLTILQEPPGEYEHLIMSIGGWPDAAEGATTAIKYMLRKLGAKKFAEIDPEEFYVFTQERPRSSRTRDGRRRVHWPANEFHYWPGEDPAADTGVLFFLGLEPNLKWRTFSRIVSDLALERGVVSVVHIGALLDAVPHSREVRLTGSSTGIDLQGILDTSRSSTSRYRGPTGITSAISEVCTNQGMEYTSLWGHTSHYLQAAPNYRVSHTLAQALTTLLDLPLDLDELATAASTFDAEVEEAIAKDDQLQKYVKKLEDRYDETVAASEMPDPADVVQDLERFLRSEQRSNPGENS